MSAEKVLKKVRSKLDMQSLDQTARETGINRNMIYRIRNEVTKPSFESIYTLCKYFGIEIK